jgi:hypothetical protein
MSIPYIENEEGVTFFSNGNTYDLSSEHLKYDEVISILDNNPEKIEEAIRFCTEPILNIVLGEVKFDYSIQKVFFNGNAVENKAINYLFHLHKAGRNHSKIEKFIEKLFLNPNISTINDLFNFVQKNKMPICEDGDFLAYKVVENDYTSRGNTKNEIGKEISPTLSWKEVDVDRNNTCSTGYHFCSWNYIENAFGGISTIKRKKQRLLVIKVNPANVASIPNDYNDSKGRATTYFIQEEYKIEKTEESVEKDFLTKKEDKQYIEQINSNTLTKQKFYNVRDKSGKFVKMS